MLHLEELLWAVFGNLDPQSLSSCSRVSWAWYQPATELMWSHATKPEYMVSKLIDESLQAYFKTPALRHLSTKPLSSNVPTWPGGYPNSPTEEEIDNALEEFKTLGVNWDSRIELFKKHTKRVTHIELSSKSAPAIRIFHVLQRCHPDVYGSLFPRVTSITFAADLYPSVAILSITSIPSLRHVTFNMNPCNNWVPVCQPAVGLTSLTVSIDYDKARTVADAWSSPSSHVPTAFFSSRSWKEMDISGRIVRPLLFDALAAIGSLETLTLRGPILSGNYNRTFHGKAFNSLRVLRMLGISNIESCFNSITIPSLTDLEVGFAALKDKQSSDCPLSCLETLIRACPNVRCLSVSIPWIKDRSQEEVATLVDSDMKPWLSLTRLERLVIQTSHKVSVRLTDDFLSWAAHAWPNLEELDIEPSHSTQTMVTLQGLAPLAHYCPNLRSLRVGLRSKYVNTVFSPKLYGQEGTKSNGICALEYLDVGCPSLYGSDAVAAFLSALFPNLRRIACPEPGNYELFSKGDYFVWNQVIRMVCNRADRDIDGLAEMLRAQDLTRTEGEDLLGEDQAQSSDCDSDYWAYSGSEDECYSDSSDD